MLIVVAFWAYKSPLFFAYISSELMPPHISLFIVTLVLVVTHYYTEYELK